MIRFIFLILASMIFFHHSCLADDLAGKIVYSQLTGQHWQIWTMDLKTRDTKQLTQSPFDKRAPQCNSEGTKLLYRSSNAELFIFDMNAGTEYRLFDNMGTIMDHRWSRDGKHVLLTRMRSDLMDDSDIWVADLEKKTVEEITSDKALQYYPVFINDQEILFVSQDTKTGGHNLWRKKLDEKSEEIQLTQGHYYDLLPDVVPDQSSAVFSSNRSGSFDIWKIDLKDNQLLKLTDQQGLETSPSVSPDGQLVVFVSTETGTKQIWLMRTDGSAQLQLTDDATQRQEPSWCDGIS